MSGSTAIMMNTGRTRPGTCLAERYFPHSLRLQALIQSFNRVPTSHLKGFCRNSLILKVVLTFLLFRRWISKIDNQHVLIPSLTPKQRILPPPSFLATKNMTKILTTRLTAHSSQNLQSPSKSRVTMRIPKPLILFIDAYDSFSNNIISLLETTLNASVRTIKIDNPALASDEALYTELRHYVAVVCGPGPGNSEKEEDVGIMRRIWRLREEELLPVLGICLGFQSLCLEFGAEVKRLKGPQHGIIRRVRHVGENGKEGQQTIFGGIGEITATLYQSLCVDIGQDHFLNKEWETRKWMASVKYPDIVPLAWAESRDSLQDDAGVMDERVLVAARHRSKPFWALQYHPESICTNTESREVIRNWFRHAQWWNRTRRQRRLSFEGPIQGEYATRDSLLSLFEQKLQQNPDLNHLQPRSKSSVDETVCYFRAIQSSANISIPDLIVAIQDMRQAHVILESSNAYEKSVGTADVRGRYSIIGLDLDQSTRFEYTTGSHKITEFHPHGCTSTKDTRNFGGIWGFLAQHLHARKVVHGNPDVPFWGGFMGYATYELGLEGIDVEPESRKGRQHPRPDLCFAWVERSLVVDHVKNVVYIQQLAPRAKVDDVNTWMDSLVRRLEDGLYHTSSTPSTHEIRNSVISITTPKPSVYESKVLACQSSIQAGDSYELCLTSQTHITLSKPHSSPTSSSWNLYKALRSRQPAPFSSYVRLGAATLVSCSPERFLTWTPSGTCELRPMKGTVKKSPTVQTLAQATKLLDIPKEKAENLMIVDLVRHDLHGVCGSGNVEVPRLMVVEEYKSVFQMISVVVGQIPPPFPPSMLPYLSNDEIEEAEKKKYTGLDVLAASLPPGSMTGAPKKRSCEILQEIEGGEERGLYSGVVGYMDVGGRGDWSVTIRCLFKWDDEDEVLINGDEKEERETWHVGAGGAVTSLSTAVGEREEMETKLAGTLGLFT
jgi:para-aminobenzoate synthetase